MKLNTVLSWFGTVLSWFSNLFNPPEVRRKKFLQKQWNEIDDIPAIIRGKGSTSTMVEEEREGEEDEEEETKLRAEMKMLLDGVVSDIKRIKDIANRLQMD